MILRRSGIEFDGEENCSPFECFVVGWCVAASSCEWRVDLCINGLGAEMVEMLGCGLRNTEEVCGYIGELFLTRNPIGQEGVVHFKELPHKVLHGISRLASATVSWTVRLLTSFPVLFPSRPASRNLTLVTTQQEMEGL